MYDPNKEVYSFQDLVEFFDLDPVIQRRLQKAREDYRKKWKGPPRWDTVDMGSKLFLVLRGAFPWGPTIQGYKYWSNICSTLSKANI